MTRQQILVGMLGLALVLTATVAEAGKGGKGKGKVPMAAWFVEPPHGDLHSDGLPNQPGQPYRDKEHRSVKVTMNNFEQLYMEVGERGPRILCLNLDAANCAVGDCEVPLGLKPGENCSHMAFSRGAVERASADYWRYRGDA